MLTSSPAAAPPQTRPLLSVVIPTRNESANVPAVVEQLRAALTEADTELCFVDDSDDDTAPLLERLAEEQPGRVRCLIRQDSERAGGLSTAVVAGLHMATGTFVCVMDADLQHPPGLIPRLLERAQEGADLVVASRYMRGGSVAGFDGLARRMVSRGASLVARIIFPEVRRSTDPLSGFFLCRRALLDGVEFRPVGFKILLELLVLLPPDLRVEDVAMDFRPRRQGQSKATLSQGLLFLSHIRSLFMDVQGSARSRKFAIVGGSGLLIYLPLLALLSRGLGWSPLLSFLPAFGVSLAWNTTLNRVWTFADQRRQAGGGVRSARYLRSAVLSGCLMFIAYAPLFELTSSVIRAGLVSAVLGMAANGFINWGTVHGRPRAWAEVAVNTGVRSALGQLAAELGADRAYVLPAGSRGPASGAVPAEVLHQVSIRRRPTLWTEAPSHRLQRRTNLDLTSALVLPVVSDRLLLGVVVCERQAPRGFDEASLQVALSAVDGLVVVLSQASGRPSPGPG